MRRYFFLFVFLILSLQSISQQWYASPVFHSRNVYSVSITDRSHIIAGGGNEQNDSLQDIFKSGSGGLDWSFSSNQGGGYIRGMDFWDGQNGLAVGYAGKIMKTTDSAGTWTQVAVPPPISQRNYTTVLFQDDQTALAFGGRNYTNDTMQTVIKSTDGGDSWSVLHDQAGRWLKGAYFIDQNAGVAVGAKGTIIKTADGGNNWTPVNSPVQARDLNAVYFIDGNTGYIVGGSYVQFDTVASFRTILKTTDGGDSWNIVMDEAGGWLTAIDFVDENTGYIVGDGATFYKTNNGGNTWVREMVTGSSWYTNFTSVKFLNEDYSVAGAMYGEVFLYSNEALPEVVTLPAALIAVTDSNATVKLRADINTHGTPAMYNFKFSTAPDFSSNVGYHHFSYYPEFVNTSTLTLVEEVANTLLPDTTYYYFAFTTSINGTVSGDTLSFGTTMLYTGFSTVYPIVMPPDSVILNGSVAGFRDTVILSFEYGTDTLNLLEIAADTAIVTDNLYHFVTASLGLPDGYYYYRLKGVSGTTIIRGSFYSFLLGPLYQSLQTLPVTGADLNSATLNGYISGMLMPATLSFEYGTTMSFGSEVPANPSSVNDSQPHTVSAQLNGLQTGIPYYYRLKASVTMGTFYGQVLSFMPSFANAVFETGAATEVTASSARLTGEIDNIELPGNLFFEYGTTPALGSSIPASPSSVNDMLLHTVHLDMSSLQPGTLYYYRLKGEFPGFNLYGNMRQVFTAEPEIPNWDFQDWHTVTTELPEVWGLATDNFEKVPGTNGHALKISKKSLALLGMIAGGEADDFIAYGGCPLTARPDSFIFQLNYTIDTPGVGIILFVTLNSGNIISTDFIPVEGNSNGSFMRRAYPVSYQTAAVPDSFVVAFIPFPMFSDNYAGTYPNNFMIIDDFEFSPSVSTLCNTGFEDWFTYDHLDPADWFYKKHIKIDPADVVASSFVLRQSYGSPVEYALEIRNRAVGGRWLGTDISNLDDKIPDGPQAPAIPVSKRFGELDGYYKFFPQDGDTAMISVAMYKNGAQVGYGSFQPSEIMNEFQPFEVLINYINDTVIPDSANVVFGSFKKHARGPSSLWIDKLSFDGFWGTDGGFVVNVSGHNENGIRIYPNPASNSVTAEFESNTAEAAGIYLLDISGRVVADLVIPAGQTRVNVDLSVFNPGIYILRLFSGTYVAEQKLVIIK